MIHSAKTYVYLFFTLVLCSLLLTGTANYVLDPYGAFNAFHWPGINQEKPRQFKHIRYFKAQMVAALKPTAIILGNSRAETGLDPQHPDFAGQKVYNLGLSGATSYEILRYFQHAANSSNLQQAILCLEDIQFNKQISQQGFEETYLSVDRNGHTQWLAPVYRYSRLFSLTTSKDSLLTLLQQDSPSSFDSSGLRSTIWWQKKTKDSGGVRKLFHALERHKMSSAVEFIKNKTEQGKKVIDGVPGIDMENYTKILQLAYRKKIDLRIVVLPTHARLETLRRMDKRVAQRMDLFLRKLVTINAKMAGQFTRPAYPIWDYTLLNELTMEKLPPSQQVKTMRWFWEGAHFTVEYGNKILHQVLKDTDSDETGVRIDPGNVGKHLLEKQRIRQTHAARLSRYREEFKNLVPEYARLTQ